MTPARSSTDNLNLKWQKLQTDRVRLELSLSDRSSFSLRRAARVVRSTRLSGMTACTVPTTAPAAVAATCVTFSATLLAVSPIVVAFCLTVFIMRLALAGAFLALAIIF
jgi:hypothetical protein